MRPDVLAEQLAQTIRGLVTPMSARVVALDGELTALAKAYGGLSDAITATRERLAVIEAREPIPGPPGPPGPAGKDGVDGKDGADGAPGLKYEGHYQPGKTYNKGDLVTAGGSAWYCKVTTTQAPGETFKDWQLMIRKGKDLRDPNRRPA